MTEDLEISSADGVQTLRLNRAAKKNALTGAMYGGLSDAIEAGDADPGIAAHVILGSGGIFSSGNDINDFLATAQGGAVPTQVLRFIRLLPRIAKPVIAGVDGPAVGIGTTLLFHCDLVYATPGAVFATPFLDLGLVPEAASSLLMPQRMGYARAFEMLALGSPFPASRMVEAGLVNAVVSTSELETKVMEAARALATKPPEALVAARRLMRGDPAEILKRTDEEAMTFAKRLASPEAREAFQAFLEKRPPDFAKLRRPG
jgi:enoyl-CoA hydratase/carnithine racemase